MWSACPHHCPMCPAVSWVLTQDENTNVTSKGRKGGLSCLGFPRGDGAREARPTQGAPGPAVRTCPRCCSSRLVDALPLPPSSRTGGSPRFLARRRLLHPASYRPGPSGVRPAVGRCKPRSHGRSVQSPGVANSGLGQLCGCAEAVISGLENSCLEQALQACPPGQAVIFPRGPSWLCAPRPRFSFSGSGWGCAEPPKGSKMGRGVAGKEASPGKAKFLPSFPLPDPVLGVVWSPQLRPAGAEPEP